ncbi:5860_t:CDS:2, partial [Funneliformis geosporum]
MEYADGGALKSYLNFNFDKLTWDDKYTLAFQLASAVSCLHEEGIVHRDLHSGNILIRHGMIKLADFGLSKRIEVATNQTRVFGVIPYIDPKRFSGQQGNDSTLQQDSLTVKSDVYSVGVLLWEISSGRPPFYVEGKGYDIDLAIKISQGQRESIIPECWDNEPDIRPALNKVVDKLNAIIKKNKYISENEQLNNVESNLQLSEQHPYS